MTAKRSSKPGIPDITQKLEVCSKLLGAYTDKELADLVLDRPGQKQLAAKATDSLRKWRAGTVPKNSSGPAQFWDALPDKLGCDATVNGVLLINANITRFIEYLPAERRARARELLTDSVVPNAWPNRAERTFDHSGVGRPTPRIELAYPGPLVTLEEGIRSGAVDQRHHYLDPDSAASWARLVRGEGYPIYDQCKAGLESLLMCESWKQIMTTDPPRSVVMLAGGGAPTKDLLLLRHFLRQPRLQGSIRYSLVDISLYMIRESAIWLEEHLPTLDDYQRAEIVCVHHDILRMSRNDCSLLRGDGRAVFGLTGLTLGNHSEADFFTSLNRVSQPGDLLFLSAETFDESPSEVVAKRSVDKYNHPDLRRFMRPAVTTVLGEFATRRRSLKQESIFSGMSRIKADLRPNSEARFSDIPNSWTVAVTLNVDDQEIALATSTRYRPSQLVTFASNFGWMLLDQVASPLDRNYGQFLFQKESLERDGI